MFSWPSKTPPENKAPSKTPAEDPFTSPDLISPEHLSPYREDLSSLCLNKCLNDVDTLDTSPAQRVCLNRCINKFMSSVEFMNRVAGYLELKVNNFQQEIKPTQ